MRACLAIEHTPTHTFSSKTKTENWKRARMCLTNARKSETIIIPTADVSLRNRNELRTAATARPEGIVSPPAVLQ